MTVKELIEELAKYPPETQIFTSVTDHTDWTTTLELEGIDLENQLYGDNVIDDYDQFDEEGEYIGKPVLMIKLNN